MSSNQLPTILNVWTGKIHYIGVASHYTHCGRLINPLQTEWQATDDNVTCGTCIKSERAGRNYRLAGEMATELRHVADYLEATTSEMQCDAGNFDGGSAATCEHCQLIAWMNRIDALLEKADQP